MKEEINSDDLENKNSFKEGIPKTQLNQISYKIQKSNPTISRVKEIPIKEFPNIRSDAFPEGYNINIYEIKKDGDLSKTYRFIEVADIHKILDDNEITLDKDMIYYQKIPISFLKELKILHNEWFPVEYSYDYLLKYLEGRSDYFNIGAFTKIKGLEYIIDAINDFSIKRNCISRLCNPKYTGYISTIGVIDEVRGIRIGKNLLSKAISILKMRKTCIGIYLHVIHHNKSAINFYTSNEFCRGKYLENFYYIKKNYYDCIVFFKLFEHSKLEANYLTNIESKIDKLKYHKISGLEDK